jgi:hypothetical protein
MSSRQVVVWGFEGSRGAHTEGPRSFSKVIINRYKMVVLCEFLVVGILLIGNVTRSVIFFKGGVHIP